MKPPKSSLKVNQISAGGRRGPSRPPRPNLTSLPFSLPVPKCDYSPTCTRILRTYPIHPCRPLSSRHYLHPRHWRSCTSRQDRASYRQRWSRGLLSHLVALYLTDAHRDPRHQARDSHCPLSTCRSFSSPLSNLQNGNMTLLGLTSHPLLRGCQS